MCPITRLKFEKSICRNIPINTVSIERKMSEVNVHKVKQLIHAAEGVSNDGVIMWNHSAVSVFNLGERPSTSPFSVSVVFDGDTVHILFDLFKGALILKQSHSKLCNKPWIKTMLNTRKTPSCNS